MNAAEPSALNELLKAWRSDPEEDTTTALCGYLGATLQLALIDEVGRTAERRYGQNADVLIAVGRMYLAASMFPAAWRALAYARRADQHDPRPFLYLAEVLLHQGEATRASELLQRALEHGVTSDDILTLNEQLVEYMEVERREGVEAVAQHFAREVAERQLKASGPARFSRSMSSSVDDDDTQVLAADDVAAVRQELEHREPLPSAVELMDEDLVPYENEADPEHALRGREQLHSVDFVSEPEIPLKSSPFYAPATQPAKEEPARPEEDSIIVALGNVPGGPLHRASAPPQSATMPPARTAPAAPLTARPLPRPPLRPASPPPQENPSTSPRLKVQGLAAPRLPSGMGESRAPLFKDETTAQRRVKKPRSRFRPWIEGVLGAAALGASLLAIYTYFSEQQFWDKREFQTRELAQLSAIVQRGNPAELRTLDARLSILAGVAVEPARLAQFQLRSCVVQTLALGQPCKGLAKTLRTAETAGVPRRSRVPGELLLAIEKGDLAGAVGLARHFESLLDRDPYFQLVAGSVFELTADPRAKAFYHHALLLDPGLRIARVLDVRLTLLDRTRSASVSLPPGLLTPLAGTLEAQVMEAFARGGLGSIPEAQLMAPARALLELVEARNRLNSSQLVAAGEGLDAALRRATSPAVKGALGLIGIEAGRIDLAERAASSLELIDADEPTARVLRARVALVKGDVGEATRLANELAADPLGRKHVIDLALLRAMVGYEATSSEAVRRELAVVGSEVAMSDPFESAAVGLQLLSGGTATHSEIQALLRTGAFWSEVVAVDAALDAGDLALAEEALMRWPGLNQRPLHLQRLARLRRYQGRFRDGLDITARLASRIASTHRLLTEHAFLLMAAGETLKLKELVSSLPEPKEPWLTALVEFGPPQVTLRIRSLPLLVEGPVDTRIAAARALGLARDPRAGPFTEGLKRDFPNNPSVRRLSVP